MLKQEQEDGERGLADRARDLGAADFIEKSVPVGELPERLRKAYEVCLDAQRQAIDRVGAAAADLPGPLAV